MARGLTSKGIEFDINSDFQKFVDNIVFEYLEIDENVNNLIKNELLTLINSRYNKSRT